MAACGKQTVSVRHETDQKQTGDEHEGRPVLGRCGARLVRGEQRGGQDEPAADSSRPPVQRRAGDGRVFRHPGGPHRRSVPRRARAETTVAMPGRAQTAAALTSVVSSALDSAFQSAQ